MQHHGQTDMSKHDTRADDSTSSNDSRGAPETVTDGRGHEFPSTVEDPPATNCPECGTNIVVGGSPSGPTGTPAGRVLYASARCADTAECEWEGYVTYALASVVDDAPPTPPRGEEREWYDGGDRDENGRGAGLFDTPRSEHGTNGIGGGDLE